jgi:hypothetical protein
MATDDEGNERPAWSELWTALSFEDFFEISRPGAESRRNWKIAQVTSIKIALLLSLGKTTRIA